MLGSVVARMLVGLVVLMVIVALLLGMIPGPAY